MKILFVLTYYRPHVSGLTIYVERLAHALVERGHQVTVLTSQYERRLPRHERLDGVKVLRVPVAFRVSKGVVMPTIGLESTRQVLNHDVISLHLPQLDAAGIALRGRLFGRPVTLTYHCDLTLPKGGINALANQVVKVANRLAASFSDVVIAYTEDFAQHSPFLSRYLAKLRVITPPVVVHPIQEEEVADFIQQHRKTQGPAIGMAARLATEKGVEYLLGAMEDLGEEAYARQLAPMLERFQDHWSFLDVLDPRQMSAFFKACDVTVLPSVNSTESFGLVQIESMICGTPVVASNLPGVRQPVRRTGMGKVIPLRDSSALAEAVLEVIGSPDVFQGDSEEIAQQYSPTATAEGYERLFLELLDGI